MRDRLIKRSTNVSNKERKEEAAEDTFGPREKNEFKEHGRNHPVNSRGQGAALLSNTLGTPTPPPILHISQHFSSCHFHLFHTNSSSLST